MATISWGLLGPEKLSNERRVRTLGVGASVRHFNELAVPGLGNVWFGKQLFLATLGIALAEKGRSGNVHVQNIETANAVEALACWLALNNNDWTPDQRLRGARKMQGKTDLAFSKVRQRHFYVSQPMRMATLQPLSALGLVRSEAIRFNSFECAQPAYNFIEAQCADYDPCYYSQGIFDHLMSWVMGNPIKENNDKLQKALSPIEPLSQNANQIIEERLIQGNDSESFEDKQRRRGALAWVESLRNQPNLKTDWDTKPAQIDGTHWQDLKAGALFFSARKAAINLLDQLESHIASQNPHRYSLNDPIPETVIPNIQALRQHAQSFLNQHHQDKEAEIFCQECTDRNNAVLLAKLVERDGQVLRQREREVVPGPAFQEIRLQQKDSDAPSEEESDTVAEKAIEWPEGISSRIQNLFLLNVDLHSELSTWLKKSEMSGDAK